MVTEEGQESRIRYIRSGELLASDAVNARTYYHYASDEMGSITHVTAGVSKEEENEEETPAGSILNHYEYDAWGNPTVCEETVENRFLFNGQQYDPVAQQYYLRARFYNPVIARFTQEDTYRGDGLNLYAYCKNNPVYYVDPSGHFCEKAAERICGLIDEGRIKGENREKLKSYLQERIDAGSITSWEQKVADKLGVGTESNFILFNRTHENAQPQPRGTGPNGGKLQSHHGLQQAWAIANLSQYGYDPRLAPTVTIETGADNPHTIITNAQNARRDAREASGNGKWSSSLQDELGYIVTDFREAGFSDSTIANVLEQQYSMLDKLGVSYERIKW